MLVVNHKTSAYFQSPAIQIKFDSAIVVIFGRVFGFGSTYDKSAARPKRTAIDCDCGFTGTIINAEPIAFECSSVQGKRIYRVVFSVRVAPYGCNIDIPGEIDFSAVLDIIAFPVIILPIDTRYIGAEQQTFGARQRSALPSRAERAY